MDKLRVLLADDHVIVREGLKLLIDAQPDMAVIGEAGDGHSAVAQAHALQPDIVVMDISMPQLNGIEATAEIIATAPAVRVLVLSVHQETNYVRRLFTAGASGYILKRSAGDVLVQAVRTVASGASYLDPLLVAPVLRAQARGADSADEPPPAELSEREAEVLRLVARGYASKEIASQINVSSKTVETYKARAMEKLGLNSRAAIVRYAVRQGWLQEEV